MKIIQIHDGDPVTLIVNNISDIQIDGYDIKINMCSGKSYIIDFDDFKSMSKIYKNILEFLQSDDDVLTLAPTH